MPDINDYKDVVTDVEDRLWKSHQELIPKQTLPSNTIYNFRIKRLCERAFKIGRMLATRCDERWEFLSMGFQQVDMNKGKHDLVLFPVLIHRPQGQGDEITTECIFFRPYIKATGIGDAPLQNFIHALSIVEDRRLKKKAEFDSVYAREDQAMVIIEPVDMSSATGKQNSGRKGISPPWPSILADDSDKT